MGTLEDIDPNKANTKYGQTPLERAAHGGYEGVVKLLLGRKDININAPGAESNWTPLGGAAWVGHEGIVKLLLQREDVNPNTADTIYNLTPLGRAAVKGHKGVVKLLLEREDINPNSGNTKYNLTPLGWAAEKGHKGVVELLLEREDVNPNMADTKYGRTPLVRAVKNGHLGVAALLLTREDINPNTADATRGGSPLWWVARLGHERVVKSLLERKDLDPNRRGPTGQTALEEAESRKHEGVVQLLESSLLPPEKAPPSVSLHCFWYYFVHRHFDPYPSRHILPPQAALPHDQQLLQRHPQIHSYRLGSRAIAKGVLWWNIVHNPYPRPLSLLLFSVPFFIFLFPSTCLIEHSSSHAITRRPIFFVSFSRLRFSLRIHNQPLFPRLPRRPFGTLNPPRPDSALHDSTMP